LTSDFAYSMPGQSIGDTRSAFKGKLKFAVSIGGMRE
jgi:hypothetical protein